MAKDRIFKIKILYWLICIAVKEWRDTVIKIDMDARYCCAGTQWDECGCGGMTNRDYWSHVRPEKRK